MDIHPVQYVLHITNAHIVVDIHTDLILAAVALLITHLIAAAKTTIK